MWWKGGGKEKEDGGGRRLRDVCQRSRARLGIQPKHSLTRPSLPPSIQDQHAEIFDILFASHFIQGIRYAVKDLLLPLY